MKLRSSPWNFPPTALRVLVCLLNCNSSFVFPCRLRPPVPSRMLDSLAKRCRLCRYHSFQISYCFPCAAPIQQCTSSLKDFGLGEKTRRTPQHSMSTRLPREPMLVLEMLLREQHAVPCLQISSSKPFSREPCGPLLVKNLILLSQQGRQGTDSFLRTEQALLHFW